MAFGRGVLLRESRGKRRRGDWNLNAVRVRLSGHMHSFHGNAHPLSAEHNQICIHTYTCIYTHIMIGNSSLFWSIWKTGFKFVVIFWNPSKWFNTLFCQINAWHPIHSVCHHQHDAFIAFMYRTLISQYDDCYVYAYRLGASTRSISICHGAAFNGVH